MAVNPEVVAWLDERGAEYEVVEHAQVFNTVAEARELGIEVDQLAKSLVVHVTHQGNQAVVVIPGGRRVSNDKIQSFFGTNHARLTTEDELRNEFPQFELGAVPPLGGLLGLPIYIDRRLVDHETVLFNGGTHTASIRMSMHDFINLADLSVVDVVEEPEAA